MVESLVEVSDNERELMRVIQKMPNVKKVRNLDENYMISGEPMNVATFKRRIASAEQDIVDGKTYTTEEARTMILQ